MFLRPDVAIPEFFSKKVRFSEQNLRINSSPGDISISFANFETRILESKSLFGKAVLVGINPAKIEINNTKITIIVLRSLIVFEALIIFNPPIL